MSTFLKHLIKNRVMLLMVLPGAIWFSSSLICRWQAPSLPSSSTASVVKASGQAS